MRVDVTYSLTGAGWAECTIQIGEAHAVVTASYLSDALDDLASAVAAALRGHPSPTASFWEEPGEYRWLFHRQKGRNVRVEILEFPHLFGGRPDNEGAVVLDAECRLDELGRAVLRALEDVERRYGANGYAEQWGEHDFPAHRIPELQELIGHEA